jgi:hypothetical protein
MKRVFGGAVVTYVMLSLFVAATATATNPHFVRTSASVPPSIGQLVVDYKVAGLANTVTTSVTLTAERTATWACKDDNNDFPGDPLVVITPSAGTTLFGPFPATGGQVTGTISVSAGGHTLQCPDGQVVTVVELSYTDVRIIHSSAGTRPIPGTFSSVVDPDWPD